jgi:hypothetical protein
MLPRSEVIIATALATEFSSYTNYMGGITGESPALWGGRISNNFDKPNDYFTCMRHKGSSPRYITRPHPLRGLGFTDFKQF